MYSLRSTAAIAAALALGVFAPGCSSYKSQVESAEAADLKPAGQRKPAPDFALKDADGRTVRLSDFRGKVVLLDFWATWCDPCKFEIPWFTDMQRRQKDRGFVVLGVSMDDTGWQTVKPFITRMGVNYRVMMADDATAQSYGGIDALPTTFLIDREGRIAAVHIGLGNRKDFEDGVERLLQDPAPAYTSRAPVSTDVAGAK